MSLSDTAYYAYTRHAEALLAHGAGKAHARRLGISERSARAALAYAQEHGVPKWRVVVIGDAHFKPGDHWYGRAIVFARFINRQFAIARERGERFAWVVIGDWHDMPACSSYDRGKKAFEGRMVRADVESGNDARALMDSHIEEAVHELAMRKIVVLGNHEYRIQRLIDDNRELEGTYGYGAPGETAVCRPDWSDHGYEVYPFLEPAFIEDVAFMHYLPNPGNGKAVSSVNMGRQLVLKALASVVVGHNHLFKYDAQPTLRGPKLCAASVGCAFTEREDWAGVMSNNAYDRGLCVLEGLQGTEFTPHFYPFTDLKELMP